MPHLKKLNMYYQTVSIHDQSSKMSLVKKFAFLLVGYHGYTLKSLKNALFQTLCPFYYAITSSELHQNTQKWCLTITLKILSMKNDNLLAVAMVTMKNCHGNLKKSSKMVIFQICVNFLKPFTCNDNSKTLLSVI